MREIKLRAWKKSENRYLYWEELLAHPMLADILARTYLETLEQYTDSKDSAGTEIYEGDCLEIYMQGDKQNNPYIVGDICEFYFDLNTIDSYMRIEEKSLKIIGNVHENPELLK